MRVMLNDPDLRPVPRDPQGLGGQGGDESEQVQWYLLGDAETTWTDFARQPIVGSSRDAHRAVTESS
jgi:hypothetical protein